MTYSRAKQKAQHWAIVLMVSVFANGPGDRGSIQYRVTSKTQEIVLASAFLNAQQYTVRIKSKMK